MPEATPTAQTHDATRAGTVHLPTGPRAAAQERTPLTPRRVDGLGGGAPCLGSRSTVRERDSRLGVELPEQPIRCQYRPSPSPSCLREQQHPIHDRLRPVSLGQRKHAGHRAAEVRVAHEAGEAFDAMYALMSVGAESTSAAQLLATVEQRDDVLEVLTRQGIACATFLEGSEFRSQKVGRGAQPCRDPVAEIHLDGGRERSIEPSTGEAQNVFVGW